VICDLKGGLMPQPIWSGYLNFGLVSIPVKVFSAIKRHELEFHLLHRKDLDRIHYEKMCPDHGEVDWADVVRGYEYQKGKYVTVDESEFAKADPQLSRSVNILDFVKLDEISLLQFDHSYYLVPEPAGAKAYFLLADVLSEEKKVAIAKVVLKLRQYIAIIRPEAGGLVMTTMVFADEISKPAEFGMPKKVEPSESERKMAKQIVGAMSRKFDPARYRDEYRDKLMALINAKVAGRKIAVPKAPKPRAVKNIMEALRKSMKELERKRK